MNYLLQKLFNNIGASSYPGSLDSFTTKANKKDDVDSSHINDLQNAIVAAQTELGTDPAGTMTDLKSRLAIALHTNGAIAQGTSDPTSPSPVEGQMFYRTDTNTFEIYDGSAWQSFETHNVAFYTSDDTFIVPTGVTKVYITMVGGGAGGGGGGDNAAEAGGGGSGGTWVINYPLTTTPAAGLTVTVGAAGTGGAGGANGADGVDGGDSVFDSITVAGGNKGIGGAGGVEGTAGAAVGLARDASGGTGGGLGILSGAGAAGSSLQGGGGGGTAFGAGGNGGASDVAGSAGATLSGAGGGGGGAQVGFVGGAGGAGFVMVLY